MLRHILITLCLLAAVQAVEVSEWTTAKVQDADEINWRQRTYTRNGNPILLHTNTSPNDDGVFNLHLYTFTPQKKEKRGTAFVLWMLDEKITTFLSGPALEGLDIELDDLNRDEKPDFLRFIDRQSKKTVEAYTIVEGLIEPLDDDILLRFSEDDFLYDEIIAELINKQIEQATAPNP